MAAVDITTYCKDPGKPKYQGLPKHTIKYYNSICAARSSLNLGSDKFWEGFGKAVAKEGEKIGEKMGMGLMKFPAMFIEGLLTPEGIENMSLFVGAPLTAKIITNIITKRIAAGLGEEITEAVTEKAAEEGAFFVNTSILTAVLGDGIAEAGAWMFVAQAAELIGEFISEVGEVVMVIQLLGMIIDAVYDAGFNQQVTASGLQTFSQTFNVAFADKLISVSKIRDLYGDILTIDEWPIEYLADNTILSKYKMKNQTKLSAGYVVDYLLKLKYNSAGLQIDFPKHDGGSRVLNKEDFNKFVPQLELMISDQNTVVSSWIAHRWPIIIVVIILLIAFFLFIK